MTDIFTKIIWKGVESVYEVLSTPLDLLGGLSIFSVIIGVFVMGIIINIVVAFVNNDFGSQNMRESAQNIKANRKASEPKRAQAKSEKKWKKNGSKYGWL
ncbi:MAG: hypothetical protein MJ230_07595 [bacterium]|nr:hypothetical protein [bacterium]